MPYDPEIWLESTQREIQAYVEAALAGTLDPFYDTTGYTDAFQVIMEFPGPVLDLKKVPLIKNLIHFEIDDIVSSEVGLGDNVYADNYNAVDHTVNPQEARKHMISFDVGIWAFDRTGGTTYRMRAKQLLENLFGGGQAVNRLRDFADGGNGTVEIMSFSGGRFVNDTVNDVPVYRSVNGTLEVRVFSRTPLSSTPTPSIEDFTQDSGLTIIG